MSLSPFCYPDPDPSFLKWIWWIWSHDTDPTGSIQIRLEDDFEPKRNLK